MEGGVEDGHMRNVGQRGLRILDRPQRGRVVQRGERRQAADRLLHLVVDDHRIAEPRPAVDDAVADRVAVDEPFDRL
jgi:hypothetical protein